MADKNQKQIYKCEKSQNLQKPECDSKVILEREGFGNQLRVITVLLFAVLLVMIGRMLCNAMANESDTMVFRERNEDLSEQINIRMTEMRLAEIRAMQAFESTSRRAPQNADNSVRTSLEESLEEVTSV